VFFVNLQLTGLLSLLAAHSQPLLSSLILNPDLQLEPKTPSLFRVLRSLKDRIDAYAAGVDGFEVMLERAVKYLRVRVERFERLLHRPVHNGQQEPMERRSPPRRGDGFRYFSHKALESVDATDSARTRSVLFSAILLSQLCQEMAAIALQHSTQCPRPVLSFM